MIVSDDDPCPTFSDAYVDLLIETLTPTVTQLREWNISQYAVVYGFDELPIQCLPQVSLLSKMKEQVGEKIVAAQLIRGQRKIIPCPIASVINCLLLSVFLFEIMASPGNRQSHLYAHQLSHLFLFS